MAVLTEVHLFIYCFIQLLQTYADIVCHTYNAHLVHILHNSSFTLILSFSV
jgi:hypothetical protein